MPLLDLSDRRPVHFVGIAGAGMSALAELFARRGIAVTGCDNATTAADDLRRLGITVLQGHDPVHVEGARAVVVTSAVARDHPELARARELGLPVIRRAEALGEAVSGGTVVGIAGTHGKTTTTVMTTEALRAAGLHPTGIVGGRVAAWAGNLSDGGDRTFVVEADEYDRSFLALTPTIAAITNVEADHLDIYRDLDDIRGAFEQFARPARGIVLCADDAGAASLRLPESADVVPYGVESAATPSTTRLLARGVRMDDGRTLFDVVFDGGVVAQATLQVPGLHNVRNALAAIGGGLLLGADAGALCAGLAGFAGVERRFQRLGEAAGVFVVDDYAHHPSEITATLQAARASFPGRRIVAAFQPHLFTRTRDLHAEFGAALAAADRVFLTEIYPAREQPIAGVSSTLVRAGVERAGGQVAWLGARDALAEALAGAVQDGDVVLTLGAGDITRTGPELLHRLRRS
ncbi:MAG TPA: UDP-N-acetylmuramate--L-alanine ligase [Gemmatimonadaceae bacterium]|nr:UDP-N-acetylmuramate--L-alanine ligase [Gemmatimonadaceae bacterium]